MEKYILFIQNYWTSNGRGYQTLRSDKNGNIYLKTSKGIIQHYVIKDGILYHSFKTLGLMKITEDILNRYLN